MEAVGQLLVRLGLVPRPGDDPCEEYHSELGLKHLLVQAYCLLVQERTNPVGGALKQVGDQVVLLLEGALREELCEVARRRRDEEDVEDHLWEEKLREQEQSHLVDVEASQTRVLEQLHPLKELSHLLLEDDLHGL